ncbi:MAG: YdeI/OmpD-associated family protein [Sphingomonadales bacterium]|nr:YdeI/OmpD-associated family protein [Sphingomonadales bacterium]
MAREPRIDAYIAGAAPYAQPILTHLRELAHRAVPGLDEAIKWGMPHFIYKGKNLAGMAAFKAHASFTIHGDSAFSGLAKDGAMGQFGKLASLADLADDAEIAARLTAACERIDATGTAVPRKESAAPRQTKAELAIPPEFAEALKANSAANITLEHFAPSHRREYVEWIAEAKRPETRDKRIAQAIEWLAEGKKRNWKYENC